MPLPLSNVVQRRQLSNSKRVRSMHVPLSPFDGRSDSPEASPISLFDRLPVELQIEIFTHCPPPLPHFDPCEAPLLITRVSQGWRALVLSVPKLWSSFEIEVMVSVTPTPLYDSYVERSVKLWLERSKNHSLTVSLIHVSVGQMQRDLSARLLAVLISEAHRWRSVQFTVPTANMIPLPNDLPRLESLGLHLIGLWKSVPSVPISTVNIPWCQLSQLDLQLEQNNLPTLGDTLSILSQTPRLRLCKITVNCTLDSGVDPDNIHLPVLEEFHLTLQGGNVFPSTPDSPSLSLTKFLHHISMPTLRALSIIWLVQRPIFWPNRHLFVSFLRRISSTLNFLDLAHLPVSETDLIQVLMLFSKVTHLSLHFSLGDQEHDLVSDNLLSLLSLRNSDDSYPFLPCLMSLDLQCNGSKFSNSALLAMVESRWKKDADPGDGFSHFRLFSMKPLLRVVEKRAQAMLHEGLDISVETLHLR